MAVSTELTTIGKPLTPAQIEKLSKESAISEGVIADRGYRYIDVPADLGFVGFPTYQRRTGLLIPIHGVRGGIAGYQLRADTPRTDRAKYEWPAGQRMIVDCPPRVQANMGNPNIPIWFTEGSKKADSGVSHGLTSLSLAGVFCYRGGNEFGGKTALPDFEEIALAGRTCYLVFDSDWRTNKQVCAALRLFGKYLTYKRAKVFFVDLPSGEGSKVGLDDYFANGGAVADLVGYATDKTPEWREFRQGDVGNAERLIALHGHNMRYVAGPGWHVWDAEREYWRTGEEARVTLLRIGQQVSDDIAEEASTERDPDERALLMKASARLLNKSAITNMLDLAVSSKEIEAYGHEFDSNPYLFAAKNGTIDLRTGEMWKSTPDDMITMRGGCDYDPSAECPRFLQYLAEIMLNREDLMQFLILSLGYTLSGDCSTHAFWFCSGTGRNGKSVLIRLMQRIMGTYATVLMPESLMEQRMSKSSSPDLAKLHRKRMAIVNEVDATGRMNIGLVKKLSAFEGISARFLFQNEIEFNNTAKIWMVGNERPVVRHFDIGIQRRFRVVPFDYYVPKDLEDERLEEKLWQEAPGILGLLVKGYQSYLELGGLPGSTVVDAATEAYKSEQDTVSQFFTECCVSGLADYTVPKSTLWAAYRDWCKSARMPALSRANFYTAVIARGHPSHPINPAFCGLSLLNSGSAPPIPDDQLEFED